jgi:hypothetical protein
MAFFKPTQIEAAKTGEVDTNKPVSPIPHDTTVKAQISAIAWATWEGTQYVQATWTVEAPAEYKDRKVWQSFYLMEKDATRLEQTQEMLLGIDANCGGKIAASNPNDVNDITDALLGNLIGTTMLLKLVVTKAGRNFIAKVSPLSKESAQPVAAPAFEVPDPDMPF